MVIEDSAGIASLYDAVLRHAGHTVKLVSEDFEGWLDLEPWAIAAPDVVIVDIALGGSVTGLDILRVVDVLTPRPRIIVASATVPINAEATAHADVVLHKPFTLKLLTEAVSP